MEEISKENYICSKVNNCSFSNEICFHREPHKQLRYYNHAPACQKAGTCGPCIIDKPVNMLQEYMEGLGNIV